MIKESLFKLTLYYFIRNCEYLGYIKPFLTSFLVEALLCPHAYFLFRIAEEYRHIEFRLQELNRKPIEILIKGDVK